MNDHYGHDVGDLLLKDVAQLTSFSSTRECSYFKNWWR
ncbi:diguanylate cyclase [Anaerobacillus sp. HL2]|nr:diguanylate cyclase [Anaerobacillus sp. HL2]